MGYYSDVSLTIEESDFNKLLEQVQLSNDDIKGITYQLYVEYYNGRVVTHTYNTEEELAEGIKKWGNQVISFKKVYNGVRGAK